MEITSAKVFFRQLESVPVLTPELERELACEQECARMQILEAILLAREGRACLREEFDALANGRICEDPVVDPAFWGLVEGVLPEDRRPDLAILFARLIRNGPASDIMRDMRLSWERIERLGCDLFCGPGCPSPDAGDHVTCRCRSRSSDGSSHEGRGCSCDPAADIYFDALRRNRKVLEKLVEANIRLVVKWARKYGHAGPAEEMDLVQEGVEGLIAAARRYDYYRGYRFSTYAVWWVRQAIIKGLLQHSRLIRIPVHALGKLAVLHREVQAVFEKTGLYPTAEETAAIVGLRVGDLHCLQTASLEPVSIDSPVGGEDACCILDALESLVQAPERAAVEADTFGRLHRALEDLGEREREVIEQRYGLGGDDPMTLESIGQQYGISRERVRQIEQRALLKLRSNAVLLVCEEG